LHWMTAQHDGPDIRIRVCTSAKATFFFFHGKKLLIYKQQYIKILQ